MKEEFILSFGNITSRVQDDKREDKNTTALDKDHLLVTTTNHKHWHHCCTLKMTCTTAVASPNSPSSFAQRAATNDGTTNHSPQQ